MVFYHKKKYNKKYHGRKTVTKAVKAVLSRQVELKHMDNYYNLDNLAQSWSTNTQVKQQNAMSQGTDSYHRIGLRVLMKYINLTFLVSAHAEETKCQTCRVALVYDKAPLAVIPNLDHIFQPDSNGLTLTNGVAENNRKRFKILWDKRFTVGPITQPGGIIQFKKKVKLNKTTVYNAELGTAVQTGGLYLCYMSSKATEKYPQIYGTTQLFYSDM